jgi:hypothetical protein
MVKVRSVMGVSTMIFGQRNPKHTRVVLKFVDSRYYSEWELCGGAVTVSFSTPLTSESLVTTLHPLLENVLQTVCRKLQEDSEKDAFGFLITLKIAARLIASSP